MPQSRIADHAASNLTAMPVAATRRNGAAADVGAFDAVDLEIETYDCVGAIVFRFADQGPNCRPDRSQKPKRLRRANRRRP